TFSYRLLYRAKRLPPVISITPEGAALRWNRSPHVHVPKRPTSFVGGQDVRTAKAREESVTRRAQSVSRVFKEGYSAAVTNALSPSRMSPPERQSHQSGLRRQGGKPFVSKMIDESDVV
ncbi:hypothetical protein CH063_15545, partial [Colletotrichum higginsianum]